MAALELYFGCANAKSINLQLGDDTSRICGIDRGSAFYTILRVKNLIVIDDLKTPFTQLKIALKHHQAKDRISKAKSLPFEANELIALIYPSPPISGKLDLLKEIKSTWPKLRIIFAGPEPSAGEVISLFREGLADYLVSPIDLRDVISVVQRLENKQAEMQFNPLKFNLTKREFEVCKLLVGGLKSKEVAECLQITPATIKVHKSRIMRKIGVGNLPDLVRAVAK